jgi:hypothetical protein
MIPEFDTPKEANDSKEATNNELLPNIEIRFSACLLERFFQETLNESDEKA